MRQFNTREDWLKACLTRGTAGWPVGADLPENTRISVGFPAKVRRGRGSVYRPVEHYRPQDSEGGMFEIFVSPTIGKSDDVAVAVLCEAARIATGREPSEAERATLGERARRVVATMPPYPHAAIKVAGMPQGRPEGTPGPGSRLIKVDCPECGYTLRTTRRWLSAGVPTCPGDAAHGIMRVASKGD
jgi:hypothetical protein